MFGQVGVAYGKLGRVASALNPIVLTGNTVPENSANGTAAGTVSLRPGHTGTASWSITDATGTFQINSSTGAITVLSNTLLDYESHTSIPVTIAVSGVTPSVGNRATGIAISNVIETPVNLSVPVISGTAQVGVTLTTTDGTWTDMAGPGAATFAYQWKRGVTNVGTSVNTYTLVHADAGSTITCVVTPTNTAGAGSAATSAATATVVEAPTNTVAPVISGTTQSGSTLTTTNGTWQGDATITFAYQWKADGVSIGGATSSTFVLTGTQVGANITCVVTGTNSVGSQTATSNSLGPITLAPTAPANTVAPVVTGTANSGQTLSTTDGTWTGTATITYTYQWQADGVDIGSATSSTFLLTDTQIGAMITCNVTGTNGVGNSTQASNAVGPVGAAGSFSPSLDFSDSRNSQYAPAI
jgi:hypothetical protein